MSDTFSNVGLLKFLLSLPELKELGSVALLDLAKEAHAIFLNEGESLYADEHFNRHLYLVDGEIELLADDQILQVIKAKSDRARMSLFRIYTHGFKARAIKKSSLLSLDEIIMERYTSTSRPKDDSGGIKVSAYTAVDGGAGIIREINEEFHHNEVDLPSLPEVALKINLAVQDENLDFQQIADIIRSDPMISARAVQVANSAMYATTQSVQTIKNAVQRIGLRAMRTIVMSVTLRNLYSPKFPLIKKRMKIYYHHSIRVGVLSHVIAKKLKEFDPEQAFLAGLIHDIGVMPILIRADKHKELINNPDLLEKIILDLSKITGPKLLKQWDFEPELITTALEADNWQRDGVKADYCDIVQVAQLHCAMIGGIKQDLPPLAELPAYERLQLGDMNPMLMVSQAKREMEEMIHLLD